MSKNIVLISLGISIFFVLFLLTFTITGRASNSAYLNITLDPAVLINFTTDLVDFGEGQVTPGNFNATINSLGECVGGTWTPSNQGFLLENMGNINVTVDLKSEKNADTFLGGTSPEYKFNVTNIEAGSCVNGTGFLLSQWVDVNTTYPGTRICSNFMFLDSNDSLRIDIQIVVPSDSLKGLQTDTFTATATAI